MLLWRQSAASMSGPGMILRPDVSAAILMQVLIVLRHLCMPTAGEIAKCTVIRIEGLLKSVVELPATVSMDPSWWRLETQRACMLPEPGWAQAGSQGLI